MSLFRYRKSDTPALTLFINYTVYINKCMPNTIYSS